MIEDLNLIDLLDGQELPLKNRIDGKGHYQPSIKKVAPAKNLSGDQSQHVISTSDPRGLLRGARRNPDATGSLVARNAPRDDIFDIRTGAKPFGDDKPPLIPREPLEEGEQYRFHFDMTLCIGCQCCVVACNEQNNNPASVNWRRVGEMEGGIYPETKRFHLSMACNHCLDPACLTGCPTDAYIKLDDGIVKHKAEECIGCGYCSWNCPYGVPQFNPERNVVTKCDMCHSRLKAGELPACVAACPEGAIQIEKVNVKKWRQNHIQADAPHVPDSEMTISTTRITMPDNVPENLLRANRHRIEPEKPHTSLIFMTVLTQLATGGFMTLWLLEFFSQWVDFLKPIRDFLPYGAGGMLLVTGIALFAAVFHLGRPLYAYKALRMWKRSWLSREVLLFALFSKAGGAYAGLELAKHFLKWNIPDNAMTFLGAAVVLFGLSGVYASAKIYLVPARPAWNTIRTPLRFFLTGFILGPLFALLVYSLYVFFRMSGPLSLAAKAPVFAFLAVSTIAGFFQMVVLLSRLFSFRWTESNELYGSSFLLIHRFKKLFLLRLSSLVLGSFIFPFVLFAFLQSGGDLSRGAFLSLGIVCFLFSLAGEFLGRYLFFVTVVPKNIPGSFFAAKGGGH